MNSKSKELIDLEFYYEVITSNKSPFKDLHNLHSTCLSPPANDCNPNNHKFDDEDLENAFENDEYNLYNFKEKTKEAALIEVDNIRDTHFTTTTPPISSSSTSAVSRPPALFQSVLNELPEHDQLISNQITKEVVIDEIEIERELPKPPSPPPTENQVVQPTIKSIAQQSEYYYYYASWEKCYEIFSNRCINLEKIFHDRQLVEGIVLLTVPPSASDNELLLEYFGSSVPIDKKQIECYIRFRREILDANKQFLTKISENKYLCKRKILFESNRLPKHQFRSKFNQNS